MRALFLATVASISATAGGAARAQTADADFRSLCVANSGNLAAIQAAADASGWKPSVTSDEPTSIGTVSVTKSLKRTRASRELIIGTGTVAVGDRSIRAWACSVLDHSDDAKSLASEKHALGGHPVLQNTIGTEYLVDVKTGATLSKDASVSDLETGKVAEVFMRSKSRGGIYFIYVKGIPPVR
jgi:hypothetical protein